MQKVEELERRISEEPHDPVLHYQLGKAYIAGNQFNEAVKALNRAIEFSPQKTRYHLLLAKVYVKQNKYAHAKKEYQKVLSIDPTNIRAHKNLALIFEFHLRDPQRSLYHYRKYSESGGDDPRVLKRFELLREEIQPSKPRKRIASKGGDTARTRLPKAQDVFRKLFQWRDHLAKEIAVNQVNLTKWLFSLSMFLIVFLCLEDFPVTDSLVHALVALAILGLTLLDLEFGIVVGLIVLFFPIAFYSALMAYLYAAVVFVLFSRYRNKSLGSLIVILLVPLLLRMNVAYVVPLGAAIWLGARPARRLGIIASIAGIAYLLARNIHQLGPLAVNYVGTPISVTPFDQVEANAFLSLQWMKSLFTLKLVVHLIRFLRSIYPALLQPPMVFIEIASWAFAGYAAGRLYKKRAPQHLAAAIAAAALILLFQAMIIESLFDISYFSSETVARCLFYSAVVISLLWFFKVGMFEEELVEDLRTISTYDEVEDVSWDSIGGLEDVKKEIQMVTRYQFQSGFSRFTKRFGLEGIKGILFYGPPGCGKTLFAKVLARDVGASFFPVKGSDFRSKWYGETEQNLSRIFEKARQSSPSIILLDEIDSMLEKRSEAGTGDSPEREIVALFLNEMDGVKPLRGVLVVGATNEPDLMDPAVLRPGRFDKLIYIPLPDAKGRRKIFHVHLRNKPLAAGIDLQELAKMTERFSGADIADVCSKVAEQAMQDSLEQGQTTAITMAALKAQIKSSKPSVSLELLKKYEELQEKYGRRTVKPETEPAEVKEKFTWEQVGGLEHVRQELIEAIEIPLKKPKLYAKYRITPPKGVLLYGPSGCGKTLMAKIIASQCNAHFLSVDMKKETSESIRKWFVRARENRPSILFFDEIDSIATSRDLGFSPGQGVVQQLLVELDGMEELKQVLVIAATNRPDRLDSALMRPGRFDRLIYIPPPDERSRQKVLKIHLTGKPLARDVDLSIIAEKTEDYSGADLAALCYEASMSLIRKPGRDHPAITMKDLHEAMEKVKSSISSEERAYFDEMRTRYSRGQ